LSFPEGICVCGSLGDKLNPMPSRTAVIARIEALNALDPNNQESNPQIEHAFKDRSPSVREFAIRFVEDHRLKAFIPHIEACLTSRNWLLRTRATVCVGDLLEPSGEPHHGLRKLLSDPEWVVRIDAMESLALIEDTGAIPQIANLLKDENGIVRSYCATILAEKCGRTYESELRKLLRSDTDPHARVGVLAALFSAGDRSLLPQLLDMLHCEIYQVRCAVVHSVEDLKLSQEERTSIIKAFSKFRRTESTRAVTSTITTVLKTLRSNKCP
jgi:HEAT repeat protein